MPIPDSVEGQRIEKYSDEWFKELHADMSRAESKEFSRRLGLPKEVTAIDRKFHREASKKINKPLLKELKKFTKSFMEKIFNDSHFANILQNTRELSSLLRYSGTAYQEIHMALNRELWELQIRGTKSGKILNKLFSSKEEYLFLRNLLVKETIDSYPSASKNYGVIAESLALRLESRRPALYKTLCGKYFTPQNIKVVSAVKKRVGAGTSKFRPKTATAVNEAGTTTETAKSQTVKQTKKAASRPTARSVIKRAMAAEKEALANVKAARGVLGEILEEATKLGKKVVKTVGKVARKKGIP